MADLGTLFTIANNVFKVLQSPVLKDVKDWESNLGNLNKSVSFIKDMLLDADMKPELSHVERAWIEELKEVLFEADDLFDEVITTAQTKELDEGESFLKKVLSEVSRFFSCKNCILVSYNTSQEVKSIQLKLDAIAKDHARYEFKVDTSKYEFKVDPQATLNRREDTCSFLDETHENIIGREYDVRFVVDMLIDPHVEENVGFVAVVGIGGLGKTTLAQLVYNNDRVGTMFEKKLWVCVSDQDGKGVNVKEILENIIEASTTKKPSDVSTMQSLQTKVQEELKNKTYLLILDDVWTEDPNEWNKLKKYLTIGDRGSRVIITTRSEKTAEVVLGKAIHSKKYMLEGLSVNDSWRLFMVTAFELEPNKANDPELIEIGKKIVRKCSSVPLAIKVLANILNGQTHKWESFEKNTLPQIDTTNNQIMSILKLSYDNLEFSLKNCFRYCALFPKSFEMDKHMLISLWMAQGYIDNSEESFLILLKLGFFQHVKKNERSYVVSLFKMHDLMHDVAQEVAGDEFIVANNPTNISSKKIRHLFIDGGEWTESYFHERNIRTCYMNIGFHSDMVNTLVANWRCLRSLRLYVPDCKKLSESIGELLHLRYLDLSENKELTTLPNAITKLYNLQSLILSHCYSLEEWPKDFYKLVNLSLLDISECSGLIIMPFGIVQVINLPNLTVFEVSSIGKQLGVELKDLRLYSIIHGRIHIRINKNIASEKENKWEGSYLEHIKNLNGLHIFIPYEARESNSEALIEKLQPNRKLKWLALSNYKGSEIRRWGRTHDDWAIIFPNLVRIDLNYCKRLDGIPLLSNLKHLEELSIWSLNNLEYMEINAINRCNSGPKDLPFFPSLVSLKLVDLEKLKGWWRWVGEGDSSSCMPHWQPPFPRLETLIIGMCPKLTSFPPCPSIVSLRLWGSTNLLGISPGEGYGNLENCSLLESLDLELDLPTVTNTVAISRLTSALGALEHFTVLNSLTLGGTRVEVEFDDVPWKSLPQNLCCLTLKSLDTLQILPTGMKHLTALQALSITCCKSLEGLPEWISCLSSLQSLRISMCDNFKSLGTIQNITSLQKLIIIHCQKLKKECQNPGGKEWPKIQHIPHISFRDSEYV